MELTSIPSTVTTKPPISIQEGRGLSERKALSLVLATITPPLLNFRQSANILYLISKIQKLGALGNRFGRPSQIDAKVNITLLSPWTRKLHASEWIWVLCQSKGIRKAAFFYPIITQINFNELSLKTTFLDRNYHLFFIPDKDIDCQF